MALRWYNGCEHGNRDTKEDIDWRRNDQAPALRSMYVSFELLWPGKDIDLRQVLPPMARPYSAVDTIPVRHLHQSIGKSKKPIVVVRWTPEGRRLLTGGHTGEFMLWNGTAFNFETVMDVRIYRLCGLRSC